MPHLPHVKYKGSLDSTGYFLVINNISIFCFLDTPCYKLYKENPEAKWYKAACTKVAKIFLCIDSSLRLMIGLRSFMTKLPGLCENVQL